MPGNPIKTLKKAPCYVESICTRCDFFNGADDELECAAYKILNKLVEKNIISLTDINNAKIDQPEIR
jgi:hypothetical protein